MTHGSDHPKLIYLFGMQLKPMGRAMGVAARMWSSKQQSVEVSGTGSPLSGTLSDRANAMLSTMR